MGSYSDEELLTGLRERDSVSITELYRVLYPVARTIVEKNSGSREDTEDVFQDGIFVLYRNVSKGEIRLECTLKTYFYSICWKIWMQRLDRKWRMKYQSEIIQEPEEDYTVQDPDSDEVKLEQTRLYRHHFLLLPNDCQQVLRLFFCRTPLKDIALIMGFRDETYAKTRKYLCKNMLRKRILQDPRCKPLL
jgi:RNA polymerase sigma factor (sigma-70 family)